MIHLCMRYSGYSIGHVARHVPGNMTLLHKDFDLCGVFFYLFYLFHSPSVATFSSFQREVNSSTSGMWQQHFGDIQLGRPVNLSNGY